MNSTREKYSTCLRQLDIVDDTLEKLGVVTDYKKLYTQTLLKIFGWFAYIGLKFEQLNEYLRKLDGDNGHGLKQAWEHSALLPHQIGYLKFMNSESATWIAIHLHLQLCKISRELNSIFGLQMTIKMGAYFTLMAIGFSELFNILLITNYKLKKTLFIILTMSYLAFNTFRLFIINYICEMVCRKAHVTGEIISKIPYPNFNVAIRENFSNSVSTVIVILVQSQTKR
ncbi:uncharacterized protein LOC116849191 [Odontomachus brunneus]|uniref:uncharacterized protein LOC116849191 n=1 Tax=Odontomachus brunneus TaxID=486640 RepID=UPI0013F290C7|nr:uncharacterized protein LOC116849191 [Odontomachus brunneus]